LGWRLNTLYNHLDEGAFRALRRLHDQLDYAVLEGCGWRGCRAAAWAGQDRVFYMFTQRLDERPSDAKGRARPTQSSSRVDQKHGKLLYLPWNHAR
jgi:hypothetical protein